jgi:hypothetical protein
MLIFRGLTANAICFNQSFQSLIVWYEICATSLTFLVFPPTCQEVSVSIVAREISDDEFTSAFELLFTLIPADEMKAFSLRHSPATVYTTLATLWMLTLQRLGGGKTLEAIVKETLTHHREILPDNKRVREGTLSNNSSAYSEARQRLTVSDTERFIDQVAQTIIDSTPDALNDRKVYIIDGTTFKLAPTNELREVYPPATNQHGETVWPILMLTVAHELNSGAALRPEFGAMYGSKNTSEAKQAMALVQRIPTGSIIFADSGYGIFSVVDAMLARQQDVLIRLTKSRFKSMIRKAKLLEETATSQRYRLTWKPSTKDRRTHPHLAADAQLEVELHGIELPNGEWLYLVTSMPLNSAAAAELYRRRYDVEHDIRDIKVTLGVEKIRAQSDAMVQKEILCSMVAYNLVVQLRKEAAKVAKLPPRRLSFTQVWNTMQSCLLHQSAADASTWKQRYEQAILWASKDKLPQRPGRSFPRQAHPQRSKSTKFMRKKTAAKTDQSEIPPPENRK